MRTVPFASRELRSGNWTRLGGNAVTLYPIFHPAAALYTPRMLAVLEEDFGRIPDLLGLAALPPEPEEPAPVPAEQPIQLGLF